MGARFAGRALLLAGLIAAPLAAAQQGATLHRGNGAEPETLDPHRATSVASSHILRDLYEGLVTHAADGSLIPGAAESWTVSRDGLRWVFELRADGRWSNGEPVTAEDFVFGLRRSIAPATGSYYAQMLEIIDNGPAILEGEAAPETLGVRALDKRRLEIRLETPAPYLPGLLTHPATFAVYQPAVAEYGKAFDRPGRLVSNGAYRLADRRLQSHVTLEANPHFHDADNVRLPRVVYHSTEDVDSELARYRAGELDWTADVPVTRMQWVRNTIPEQFHAHPYFGTYYYGFNLTRPPFEGAPGLRRALAMVIDRSRIAGRIVGTGEQPAFGFVPPGLEGYEGQQPEWAEWSLARRREEARRLYRAAGYSEDEPLEVELRYNTQENHRRIAIAIAWMWREHLGVRTRLINEEFKVFLTTRRLKQDTQVFRAGWIGDYQDAFTFLEILHSSHGLNDTGYASRAYDAHLEAAAEEADAAARAAHLQAAEAQLLQDLPVLPIYFYTSRRLVKPHVAGWEGNLMDVHPTRFMRLTGRGAR